MYYHYIGHQNYVRVITNSNSVKTIELHLDESIIEVLASIYNSISQGQRF